MPIVWIEESSPLTIAVEDDDGTVLNSMTVEGVDAADATWRLTELENAKPANPVYNKGFRMKPDCGPKGDTHRLKLEIDVPDQES